MRREWGDKFKDRRAKYVFILREYLPLGKLDIAVSTNKQMILEKAKKLLKELPEKIWKIQRAKLLYRHRNDDELKQFLKDNPNPFCYSIVIYDNTSGKVVDAVVVTDRTTLPAY